MPDKLLHEENLNWFVRWGQSKDDIRAILLTSSLTVPGAPVDVFSDYDVIVVTDQVNRYHQDRSYLSDFGVVLSLYQDPMKLDHGFETFGTVTQYENGAKVDYTFVPVGWIRKIASLPTLPEDLDLGYRVLLDKDGLTAGLKPPSHRAYIPQPPSEGEYLRIVEEFYSDTGYVAKNIWRGDLIFMKYNLDHIMKFQYLRTMLEWLMEIDLGWSVKTGAYGRGLQKRIRPEIWAEFEETYVGAGAEENWKALFCTIDLFRKVALEVGLALGFAFPEDLHARVYDYLQKIKTLPPNADTFAGVLYNLPG